MLVVGESIGISEQSENNENVRVSKPAVKSARGTARRMSQDMSGHVGLL